MPSLDFRVRFKYEESSSHIQVPLRLSVDADRSVNLFANVDSGAEFCIFKREYAEMLDLDLDEGVRQGFVTATGRFETRGHMVKISCLDYEVESQVFFPVEHNFQRNVLGLRGWLEKFRFAVVHYDRTIYLSHDDE